MQTIERQDEVVICVEEGRLYIKDTLADECVVFALENVDRLISCIYKVVSDKSTWDAVDEH